jgi:hypothetical protein
MLSGLLPEIHVWAGIVESQELLDLSTGAWPAACQRLLGLDWPGIRPPEFFWGKELPNVAHYEAKPQATIFAGRLIETMKTKGLLA